MEIERKFLISELPENIEEYDYHIIEQAYLTTEPVIRVRKQDDEYYMTYKSKGLMVREEYNLPLTENAYNSLKSKAEGNVITKKRVLIPYDKYTIELDIFEAPFSPLILAEVEFESEEEALSFKGPDWFIDDANAFIAPTWFTDDVTNDSRYHNSNMSKQKF